LQTYLLDFPSTLRVGRPYFHFIGHFPSFQFH
jgi:hypothetical protein